MRLGRMEKTYGSPVGCLAGCIPSFVQVPGHQWVEKSELRPLPWLGEVGFTCPLNAMR